MFKTRGGGGQRPFEQCSKKLHYWYRMASLTRDAVLQWVTEKCLTCFKFHKTEKQLNSRDTSMARKDRKRELVKT